MATAQSVPQFAEAELIARVLGGDHDAFYDLVRPHERSLYVAAVAILKNDADAEEVAQEAVLKAFTSLAQFRGEAKFSTWLIQITVNEARMRLRRYRSHLYDSIDAAQVGDDGEYFPKDYADWREIPSQAAESKQLRKALAEAMLGLGDKYRQVFMMRDVQGLSTEETCALLGLTESAVKTRLLRARLMMRDALAPGWDGGWRTNKGKYRKARPW